MSDTIQAQVTGFSESGEVTSKPADKTTLAHLFQELRQLCGRMVQTEQGSESGIAELHPEQQASSRNLLHYLALRREDFRPLQDSLSRHGLSSLGRCEANVMANLHAVLRVLSRLVGDDNWDPSNVAPVDFESGPRLIAKRTRQLFGTAQRNRGVHIMVTMPSEAADNYALISNLVAGGMDCMRVNCAHDDERVWLKMIENLRRAERELGRKCHLFMDLCGPKLRTGHLGAVQSVLRWKPKRDSLGRVLVPARVWMTPDRLPSEPPVPADVTVRVVGDWLGAVTAGQEIRFVDAAGRKRAIRVMETTGSGIWGESDRSAYLTADTRFELCHGDGRRADYPIGRIGLIQPMESYIVISQGDRLILCDAEKLGGPAGMTTAADSHNTHTLAVRYPKSSPTCNRDSASCLTTARSPGESWKPIRGRRW